MKRNHDILQKLLAHIEANEDGNRRVQVDYAALSPLSRVQVDYHLRLLIDAGFIEGGLSPHAAYVDRLTWAGHEYLQERRSEAPGLYPESRA